MPRGHLDLAVPSFVTIPITPCLSPTHFQSATSSQYSRLEQKAVWFHPSLGEFGGLDLTGCSARGWYAVGPPAASGSSVSPQSSSNGTSALWTGLKHTDRYGSQETKGTRRRSLHHDRGRSWGQGPPEQTWAPNQRPLRTYSTQTTHPQSSSARILAFLHCPKAPSIFTAWAMCRASRLPLWNDLPAMPKLQIPTQSSHQHFSNPVGLSISQDLSGKQIAM